MSRNAHRESIELANQKQPGMPGVQHLATGTPSGHVETAVPVQRKSGALCIPHVSRTSSCLCTPKQSRGKTVSLGARGLKTPPQPSSMKVGASLGPPAFRASLPFTQEWSRQAVQRQDLHPSGLDSKPYCLISPAHCGCYPSLQHVILLVGARCLCHLSIFVRSPRKEANDCC